MALYQYSWLILLAPLFSFAVIIFGTRMWDLLSRPKVAVAAGSQDAHEVDTHKSHEHGDDHDEHALDDDEDPKVAKLTMGARVSGYVAIAIMALACLYSWVLLLASALASAGVLPIALALPVGCIHLDAISYTWLQQSTSSYVI